MKHTAVLTATLFGLAVQHGLAGITYPIVDTGQTTAIGNYYGQDAHYLANAPAYTDNGDGTVTDNVTGLMWIKDPGEKMTWEQAMQQASKCRTGGYDDWRLPSIKELYSLIQFTGLDPDPMSTETGNLIPFIDNAAFDFKYGDPAKNERIIDSQFATTAIYTSTTMRGAKTMFGVNFADGRIKGYGLEDPRGRGAKTFHVLYVRGNPEYGKNKFKDNGDGTVTDEATGLTWMKADSGKGMDWPAALEYAEGMEFAGHDDWRLPSAKELQSLVDYSRAPDSTGSAAIDPVFEATAITNAGGKKDYAAYWSGTSHLSTRSNASAVYVNFGRSLGWMEDRRSGEKQLLDVHGAGAQRSDPKTGDPSRFPYGRGPQGDVIGINNMVCLVRGGSVEKVDPPVTRETQMRENAAPQNQQQRPNRQQGQQAPGMSAGQRSGGAQTAARSRPRDSVRARDVTFNEKFPVGSTLPDALQLYNTDRKLVPANSIFNAAYTVVVGGCLTCPEYRNSYPEIEAVAADYRDKGVQFYFLYQSLTHPENWGFVQPTSIQERFAQVEHAKELLQTSIPWLTDTMDNEMKQHFAMAPNAQFIFDRNGKIVHRSSWGRGSSLREALEKQVGPSDTITSVADLNLPKFGPHKTSTANSLLEPKRLDGVAVPLRVAAGGKTADMKEMKSPDFGASNRYVKLRPEADQNLIRTGSGQLYLGFRQDPVLGAAWNNLATPPKYRITAKNAKVSPAMAEAPKLSVEHDTEPREFLVDVKNWKAGTPIKVEIQYFACNEDKGWCEAVQQEFIVWLEKDETAGMVAGRSHFPGGNNQNRQQGQNQRSDRNQGGSVMQRFDRNNDGRISEDEFTGPIQRFLLLDVNSDGYITEDEVPAARPGGRQ
ncbi:DUF1566 domain-containing protein [Pontiella sp.]|uniref:Lcl domain-containing protein n=1 Tax=Pontiella sp. TaxID=2837462 RepID=UPI003567F87E